MLAICLHFSLKDAYSAQFAVVCCQVLAAMTNTFSAAEQTRNVSRICSSVTVIRIVVTAPTKHSAVNYSFPNALQIGLYSRPPVVVMRSEL